MPMQAHFATRYRKQIQNGGCVISSGQGGSGLTYGEPEPIMRERKEIMFAFLTNILRRTDTERPNGTKARRLTQSSLLIIVCGIAILCTLAYSVAADAMEAIYRMTWMLLCAAAVIMAFCLGRMRGSMTPKRAALIVLAVLVQMFVMHMINICWHMAPDPSPGQKLLVLPYMLAPAVVAVLVNRAMGVFVALCCTFFGVAIFPYDSSAVFLADYMVISLLTGILAAAICGHLQKRQQILYSGFKTGTAVFVAAVILTATHEGAPEGVCGGFRMWWFFTELLVTLGVNFLIAIVINGVLPLLESIFRISTHITWLEWADMNHPLLKKLQIMAPGTFHHSLYVQRLSEAAAEAIGADVTRAGVSALYHDIGKINNPQYFSENIIDQTQTPHAELTPEASARIITGHVTEGVGLAREHKLNPQIIDVIREHHGVTTAYFFYRKALDKYETERKKYDDGLNDSCPEEVDKSLFTYKGPIPQSRESGIVSMADAVESATRSLQHPTEDDIRSMIESIFKGRILDGHLQDSGLTLGEIARMKDAFFSTLRTMNHNRIAYPKPRQDDASSMLADQRKETAKTTK